MPGTSVGPPQCSLAPLATASSTSSRTSSNCSSDTIGPISVFQSSGSPTRRALAPRTTPVDEAVGHLAHHVDALDARAGLARVGESAPEAAGDGVRQVRVGQHQLRVLAAKLEHAALQALGARHAHAAADLHRAGEEDLRHAGLHQRAAHGAAAVHGPDEPLRHARPLEDRLDPLTDQRRERGGLEHDPVAAHQRDRHLAERDRPGVVPGRDHPHHAERLIREPGLLLLEEDLRVAHPLVAEDLLAVVGDPVERVDRGQQLHHVGLVDGLALLAREQAGDVVEVVDDRLGRAAHVARPVGERELCPEGLHARHVVHHRLNFARAPPCPPSPRTRPSPG